MFKKAVCFKKIESFFQSEYTIYTGLFFCSYFFVLINNGMYWDTFTVYGQSFDTVARSSMAGGNPLSGYSVFFIINWLPHSLARILVCALYLLAGIFLNEILKRVFILKPVERFMIVVVFLILPVNFARVNLIIFPYALGYFSFFLGGHFSFLSFISSGWKGAIYRISSLVLIYFSFIMLNSLLVFYFIFLVLPLISTRLRNVMLEGKLRNIFRYMDFILLPIIFYGVKALFFTPYGSYQGYNEIKFANVILALKDVPFQIWNMIDVMLYFDLGKLENVALIIFSMLVFYIMISIFPKERKNKTPWVIFIRDMVVVIFLSSLCMWLAVFPYAAVAKPIIFSDWWSRNQILTPLGLSLIFYIIASVVARVLSEKLAYLCFSLLVSFCIVKNGIVYYTYLLDNFKQQCLVEEFKSNSVIKDGTSFIVRDQAYELNTFDRIYRFYEYSGLMRQAFGDQRRFAVNESHYNGDMTPFKGAELDSRMNIKDHPLNSPNIMITISLHENHHEVLSQLFWAYVLRDSDTFDMLKLDLLDVDTKLL